MRKQILFFKNSYFYQNFSIVVSVLSILFSFIFLLIYLTCSATFFSERAFIYANSNPEYLTPVFANLGGLISFFHYFYITAVVSFLLLSLLNYILIISNKTMKLRYILSCVSLLLIILSQIVEAIMFWSLNSPSLSLEYIMQAYYRYIFGCPVLGLYSVLLIIYIFLPYFYAGLHLPGKKKIIFTSLNYLSAFLCLAGVMSLYINGYIECLINGAYNYNGSIVDVTLMSTILFFAIFSIFAVIVLLIKPLKIKLPIILLLTILAYAPIIYLIYSSNVLVSNTVINICTYITLFLAPLFPLTLAGYVTFRENKSSPNA